MLSVHANAYDPKNPQAYHQDFFTPGSHLAAERGPYPVPHNTFDPLCVARFITENVWSPIVWQRGKRAEKNFASALWIALDFDRGSMSLIDAVEEFGDYAHVIGTTKSHQVEKHGATCDRFRVLLRSDEVISDLAKYRHVMAHVVRTFDADEACKDGARFFYPCTKIVSAKEGRPFPVSMIDPPKKQADPPIDWSDVARTARVPKSNGKKFRTFTHTTNHFLLYGAPEGSRNVTVFKVCCDMFRKGISEEEIYATVASRTDLPQREIRRCLQSARSQGG